MTELPLKAVNNAIDKEIVPVAYSPGRSSGRWLTACGLLALGGEPTFRGARIPIHLIASLLLEGATEAQLKESYPRLTRQMIQLAPLYAAAYPLRGRPRQSNLSAITPKRIVRTTLPPAKS